MFANFDKGDLPLPPGRHFAILTCMDARLDQPNTPGFLKEMPMSFATPVAEPVMMRFDR